MKMDISNKEDIELVMVKFYEQVKADPVIGFFFSEVVHVNWPYHMQKMCAFWENALFFTGEYEGNPIATHRYLNRLHTTTPAHFAQWMKLFEAAVDGLFAGPHADKMKQRSKAIAAVMMEKI
ncbi:group III truncated hemoglobin [Niabella yanshanensis]|uniref:Group III truncated hemoglobin n=1 Tax=Niabella yanshanensis TaxID=577386 RepID=A0ABZ0WAD5_9BACT|nr:group III truncated hemoglobin [Niabella yanshanensis]WQD40237.1 group III truncated hemoglobin [Niabella yanshanensis]